MGIRLRGWVRRSTADKVATFTADDTVPDTVIGIVSTAPSE
jgi:hypothetical protein